MWITRTSSRWSRQPATRPTSTIQVTGTVNPDISRTVPVISIASGRVVEVHARIGDYVKKGQLLMDVQSTDVSGAFSSYLKAVNDERLAKVQLDRAKLLNDKGAIPNSQVEIAQNAEDDAKAALVSLRRATARARCRQGSSCCDREGSCPGLRLYHRAECHTLPLQLELPMPVRRTLLPSPICRTSGSSVTCTRTILPTVHLGQKAEIRLTAYPDRVLTGVVSDIGAVLDPQMRTAKVRIQVENPRHADAGGNVCHGDDSRQDSPDPRAGSRDRGASPA